MLNNEIGNTSSPSLYVVWEGLIATCGNMPRFRWLVKTRRYGKALAMYETHQRAVDAMWQAMMRGNYGVSVVTHLPDPVAALLSDRLETDTVPCREFLALSASDLVHRLPHMPWVWAIADPEVNRARAYGSFGRYVPPEQAEMIGYLS